MNFCDNFQGTPLSNCLGIYRNWILHFVYLLSLLASIKYPTAMTADCTLVKFIETNRSTSHPVIITGNVTVQVFGSLVTVDGVTCVITRTCEYLTVNAPTHCYLYDDHSFRVYPNEQFNYTVKPSAVFAFILMLGLSSIWPIAMIILCSAGFKDTYSHTTGVLMV